MSVIGNYYCFFFQAEDGIRDLVRSRGLGDVYKRQLGTRVSKSEIGVYLPRGAEAKVRLVLTAGRMVRVLSLIHI